MNMLCDNIQDITDKNGPIQESRNGGHGLSTPKTTMYAEKPIAIQNSMLILITDTSYDQMDRMIANGRHIKPRQTMLLNLIKNYFKIT
jgi:hypothetical protein